MAQRVQVLLEDDLDGGPADETLHFALDGKSYEIDLTSTNAEKLRAALGPYLDRARKVGSRGPARRFPRTTALEDTARIREWARDNGYELNDRGRIPATVREAYEKAH